MCFLRKFVSFIALQRQKQNAMIAVTKSFAAEQPTECGPLQGSFDHRIMPSAWAN